MPAAARPVALVIGARGQLGQDLLPALEAFDAIGLGHADVEVADGDSVLRAVRAHQPSVVINTSAYHRVDEVESEPERAFAVNAVGARNVALAAKEVDASLVHLSTDYVFSGKSRRPYVENDAPEPANVYGVSKLAGELLIRYAWPKHFVVRTSGLYGIAGASGKGGNFVETMLRLAREGRDVRVVNDQTVSPTYTVHLARQIAALVGTTSYGLYHATAQDECTWLAFAERIFELSGSHPRTLSPQSTAESGAKATRPAYSVLDNAALRANGLDLMPSWKDGLAAYLAERATRRAAVEATG
jgi:dTDP-4-dehydrorhamnose reductase